MYKLRFFSVLALHTLIAAVTATPIVQDVNLDSPISTENLWEFEDDDISLDNSTESHLVARDPKHFRIFRVRFYTQSCGINGENCVDASNDIMKIHTDCNGGSCHGEKWFEYDSEKRLCDQEFNVCGTKYWIKYTGKEWSCMRLTLFANIKGSHHGRTYGYLMRDQTQVGTCYVDTKRWYGKSCSAFGSSDFWSVVQCFFE